MRLSTLVSRFRHAVNGSRVVVQAVAAVTGGFYEGWLLGGAAGAAEEGDVRRFLLGFDERLDNLRLKSLRFRAEHARTAVTEAFWEGRVVVLEEHLGLGMDEELDEDEDLLVEDEDEGHPTVH